MSKRIPFHTHARAIQPLLDFSHAVHSGSTLERPLIELVLTRASQINACAYCIDMHTKDARAAGETEQRLHLLPAWREVALYSARERAALAWTESVTRLGEDAVPDAAYEQALAHFSEEELVQLTVMVGLINVWNRMSVAFRVPAGNYRPTSQAAA